MLIGSAMYFILCIGDFFYQLFNRQMKVGIYVVLCAILLFFMVVRDITQGPDSIIYSEMFSYIRNMDIVDAYNFYYFEGAYSVLNNIIGRLFEEQREFLVIMSTLIFIPIFYRLWKTTSYPTIGLIVFLAFGFWFQSTIYRQYFAMAILTFSYGMIVRRQLLQFIILILIAFAFHHTAIIFSLLYPLYRIKITKFRIILSMIFSGIMGLFGGPIFLYMSQFSRNAYGEQFNGGISMLIFLWGIVLLSYVICEKNLVGINKFYFIMVWCSAIIQPLSLTAAILARLVLYFYFGNIFFIPILFKCLIDKIKRYEQLFAVKAAFYIALFVIYASIGIVDYKFMWE